MGRLKMQKILYLTQKKMCAMKIFINTLIKLNVILDHCYTDTKTKLCAYTSVSVTQKTGNVHSKFKILAWQIFN